VEYEAVKGYTKVQGKQKKSPLNRQSDALHVLLFFCHVPLSCPYLGCPAKAGRKLNHSCRTSKLPITIDPLATYYVTTPCYRHIINEREATHGTDGGSRVGNRHLLRASHN
jgi:hypothetical protein